MSEHKEYKLLIEGCQNNDAKQFNVGYYESSANRKLRLQINDSNLDKLLTTFEELPLGALQSNPSYLNLSQGWVHALENTRRSILAMRMNPGARSTTVRPSKDRADDVFFRIVTKKMSQY